MKKILCSVMLFCMILGIVGCSQEVSQDDLQSILNNMDSSEVQEVIHDEVSDAVEETKNEVLSNTTTKDFTDWMLDPTTFTEEDINSLQCIHDMTLCLHWETGSDAGFDNQWICVTGVDVRGQTDEFYNGYAYMQYSFNSEEDYKKATESAEPVTIVGYYESVVGGISGCIYIDSELHDESFIEIARPLYFNEISDEFFGNPIAFCTNHNGEQLKIVGADITMMDEERVMIYLDMEPVVCYAASFDEIMKVNMNYPCTITGYISGPNDLGCMYLTDCTFEVSQ